MIVFRCDGDDRIGAGHVARCLQIALAFEGAGVETVFAGTYGGIAASLLESAGAETRPPGDGPAGVPAEADAAVVDSYEIERERVAAQAELLPLATIEDGTDATRAAAVVAYHPGAPGRLQAPEGTVAITGPDYAPVRPRCLALRRERGFRTALVTVGGGTAGEHLVERVVKALGGDLDIHVALRSLPPGLADRQGLTHGFDPGGLEQRIAWADVAVSAAGSTPYELACAGVPSVLLAIADNQWPVAADFDRAGLALGIDARDPDEAPVEQAIEWLGDPGTRTALATAGPRAIDGYGAFRTRDALRAAFESKPLPRVLRYRPARREDAAQLLEWRNAPEVREVSRTTDPVRPHEHANWLDAVLADPDRTLLVIEHGEAPAGTLRFDREADRAEISITIASSARGAGLGTQAIRESTELFLAANPDVPEVLAEVKERNTASITAFERAGYAPAGRASSADGVLLTRRRTT